MRRDIQEIFKMTPHEKQVMMFSATLGKEIRPICKKFMQDVIIFSKKFHLFCLFCTSFLKSLQITFLASVRLVRWFS